MKTMNTSRLDATALRVDFAREVAAPALAKAFGARRIWLFGSVAKGEAEQFSDIDLLVDAGVGMGAKERLFKAAEVIESLDDIPCGVDVIVLTEDEIQSKSGISSIKSVLAERKVIYEC